MHSFFRHHGLSVVVFSLFAVLWAGQLLTGWSVHNEERKQAGEGTLSLAGEIRGHYVILDICTGGGFPSRPWRANFGSSRTEGFTT